MRAMSHVRCLSKSKPKKDRCPDMTDRHVGYTVVLDSNIRSDDAQQIIDAIKMIKHVVSVEPVVSDFNQHSAEARARRAVTENMVWLTQTDLVFKEGWAKSVYDDQKTDK